MVNEQGRKLFKADLHMHSYHSGVAKHLKFLRCRDCYSKPVDVYRTAKRRGMDLVTITDHDSIDGCLELLDKMGPLEDFVIAEEVSARLPEFHHTIHIGTYDITEKHHQEFQRLRKNANELIAYLKQENILYVLNHFFHDFGSAEYLHDYTRKMAELFNVFEVQNGSQQQEHNNFIKRLLNKFFDASQNYGWAGGSDAHTLRRIGRTFTASYAHDREEFLSDIREGRTRVFGAHSDHLSLAADIYGVILRYYPAVLLPNRDKFPFFIRLKNIFLALLTPPFLITPYVIAVRHSLIERNRINHYSELLQAKPGIPT